MPYSYPRSAPNTGLQRTALCAREIIAFLKSGIDPTAFPIYGCAAAEAQAVGRQAIIQVAIKSHIIATLLQFSKTISLDAP